MTDFEFYSVPTPGSNRSAAITNCETCGGDRLIPVNPDDPHGAYAKCPACHPGATERAPVAEDAWWKK